MPTYKYKCSGCSKNYLEHRDVLDTQSYTHCDICNAEYIEVTE